MRGCPSCPHRSEQHRYRFENSNKYLRTVPRSLNVTHPTVFPAHVPFRVPVVLYFPQERGVYQYDQVVRRASVGDSLAALVAGYRPATPPIN
ncbi:uncharacterized protein METZ01_LOCUS511058, partial [marine metagenome]